MVSRKPTVLTPKVPRASRAKAVEPTEVREWAPRPGEAFRVTTDGWPRETLLLTDDEFDAEICATDAPGRLLEYATRYGYLPKMAENVVTVEQLAKRGMAREVPGIGGTRWQISVEGQRLILESMGL